MVSSHLGRELQQKWKYIRDAYIRQMRLASKKHSGDYTRTYIYAKYLTFLKLEPLQSRTAIWNVPTSEEDTDKRARAFRRRKFLRPNYTGIIRAKRYKSQPVLRNTLTEKPEDNVCENTTLAKASVINKSTDCCVNDDIAFFRSLLPTLSELEPSQKLLFRIDVMKILHSYATQSNYCNSDNRIATNTSSLSEDVLTIKEDNSYES